MQKQELKGHLDLILLSALADGPAHGYALIERLRERSDGVLTFPEGTVYPALHKLERQALVSSRWVDAGGRRRRVYALTRRGDEARQTRVTDWRTFTRAVEAVLVR